jgi:hypothetical protein
MPRKLIFELLDIPYFSRPNVLELDLEATAAQLRHAKAGGAFMTYDPAFSQIKWILAGATVEQVAAAIRALDLSFESHVLDVAYCLFDIFHNATGHWYASKRRPIEIWKGAFLKGGARGVYVSDRSAKVCIFNARVGPTLNNAALRFIARGGFEMHVRDDVNINSFSIFDLSKGADAGRQVREYKMEEIDPLPLDQFEAVSAKFFEAARIAGFTEAAAPTGVIADLFRSAVR